MKRTLTRKLGSMYLCACGMWYVFFRDETRQQRRVKFDEMAITRTRN